MCNIGVPNKPNRNVHGDYRYMILEITYSLPEEFPGLMVFTREINSGSLEITFIYIPLMINEHNPHVFSHNRCSVFTINYCDIVNFNTFEHLFRERVINEVIKGEWFIMEIVVGLIFGIFVGVIIGLQISDY